MGYRTLLKRYIQHLEMVAGDNYVETENPEALLNTRDLGELKTLAAEILRDAQAGQYVARTDNYNYRLRLLVNRHGLEIEQVAELTKQREDTVRRWRTSPKSKHYLAMSEADYSAFERGLTQWLETSAP